MKKLVTGFLIAALSFLVLAAVLIATGHASTTQNHSNSLGVSEIYTNPNRYLLALPVEGQILEGYTNIRFKPYATYALYDETVLFCGDVTSFFEGKQGVLVITYRARSSRMYKGIGCHEMISVFALKGMLP
jgi:hypothetical protein